MNTENESLGREAAQAARAAQARPDAAAIVDAEMTSTRNQLGGLENARGRGMTDREVDAAQCRLLTEALSRFRTIADAPAEHLHGLLHPYRAPQPLPPHEAAAALLSELRGRGVDVTALPDGQLALRPSSQVTPHLRSRVAELREHLAALLDTLFIAGRAPDAAA